MSTKISIPILLTACFFAISSCLNEQLEDAIDRSDVIRLVAHMESQEKTKTILEKSAGSVYFPLWESSDSIAVFTKSGQSPAVFKLVSGENTTEGIFEGRGRGERYVAISPYIADAQLDGSQLWFSLPACQNGFFPMISVSETADLQFKNLCSIIKISLTGSCVVGSITLHSETQFLSGPATVNLDYADAPALVMQDGSSHDVTLYCGAVMLNNTQAKDFYIVVPANSYDGLTISVDTYTQTVTKSISHEFALKRSELRPVSPFLVEAPMMDLDNIPDNQIWYKTSDGNACSSVAPTGELFNATIVSNVYEGGYGIIMLDRKLTEVNDEAFASSRITELHLPDCVESIGANALPHLSSFRVPGCLKSLGFRALVLVDSVYGPLVLDGCSIVSSEGKLLNVVGCKSSDYTTPAVMSIGKYCFLGNNYETLTISEGCKEIDNYAFEYANVKRIVIPESTEQIGNQTIIYGLEGFYGSSRHTSEDHLCLINPDGANGPTLVGLAGSDQVEIFTIPKGITTTAIIFSQWPNLRKIIIPESFGWFTNLGLIGDCPKFEGFEGPNISADGRSLIKNGLVMAVFSRGIKEYTIPAGAHTIQMSSMFAFSPCELETLTIGEGVQVLNQYGLEECHSLRTIHLPTTLKQISYNVFSGDENLESIYLPVRVPPTVSGGPGEGIPSSLKIYVPEESYDVYMSEPTWGLWQRYIAPYHFDNIDPPAPYESSDFTLDGQVTVLQEASEGKGIDIVFMGDAFSDRMIEDGRYLAAMERMVEAFFSAEPYRTYKHLFNLYAVNVVSSSEDYTSVNLALDSELNIANGSAYANPEKCMQYALKAIPDERLDEATIVVVVNSTGLDKDRTCGTCSMMMRKEPESDYGTGLGLAVFSYPWSYYLVQHEVGGHGFAKLSDEYTSRSQGAVITIPDEEKERFIYQQQFGWWKNIDFTSDPATIRWARFLSDSRYEKEKLGVYEGAGMYYSKGIYRPSEDGLMNDGIGGFNAPSREAIYYRIHKLAFGSDWEYDYEKFVEYDQGAKNIRPTSQAQTKQAAKTYEVRDPLPVTNFNPDEWTITTMQ